MGEQMWSPWFYVKPQQMYRQDINNVNFGNNFGRSILYIRKRKTKMEP